MKLFNEGGLN